MTVTTAYIQGKFDEFNTRFFDGKLPPLPIRLSNARTFLGQLAYKRKRNLLGREVKYDFVLKISTCVDLPEEEVEDTIIHEMIHYYIGVNQLRDTSAHGQLFRRIMNEINEKGGRHITVSYKLSKEQREAAVDKRPKQHVVAIAELTDGRTGLKVLPMNRRSVTHFRNNVMRIRGVRKVDFYITIHPYFNRYPCSSAIKLHIVDRNEIPISQNGENQ